MKQILVVVDMQEDFVRGSLGFAQAVNIIEPIRQKIDQYQAAGQQIVFTRDSHGANYLGTQEGRNLPIPHCLSGSPGREIVRELAAYTAGCRIFDKPGFGSLEFVDFLRAAGYQQVEICGLVSNICVLFAAVLAKTALPEAKILIDAKCTASYDQDLHTQTLAVLAGAQFTILPA